MIKLLFSSIIIFIAIWSINAQIPTTTINSISIVSNNVSGGGFQSDVTITDDGLTVYSSADVSGIFKSTDGGLLFENINEGLKSPKVASLAITPDNDQILYAGTGDKGGSGGLFRSIDAGDTWVLTTAGDSAQFAGNHSLVDHPIPDGHPRSNGDLIIVDTGDEPASFEDDIVVAGTYKEGVKIFTEGGDVFASQVEVDGFVRSVAYNDSIPDIVYAAIYFEDETKNGIYEIEYTDPTAPISNLRYATPNPEGLTVLSNGRVYAAIGKAGIVKFNGTNWSLKNDGLDTGNELRQWTSVTGYVKGNNDYVYIGVNNLGGTSNGTNYSSIWRTVNNGNTWIPLVDADMNVSDQIYGQTYDWWFRTEAFQQAGLGRTNNVVSSIDVARGPFPDVASDDIVYVSGRGGIWKSEDGGTSWNPTVYNMQATSNRGVAVNPNDPNQIVIANTDYVVLQTGSNFENDDLSRDKPSGAESRGYDIIFDKNADKVILGVGDRDTNFPGEGEVYIKPSSDIGSCNACWVDTDLRSSTDDNNGRVRAVSYGYHDGDESTSQIVLAAVEGEGVFRYFNNQWVKSSGIEIGNTKRCDFLWPDNENSGVVYLLDLKEGFYRSNDGGVSWSNIWPSMSFKNNDFFNTGYLTADDSNPTTLYLSIQGNNGSPIGTGFRVYRMTNADVGEFDEPDMDDDIIDITSHSGNATIERPGPITLAPDGRLWVTQQQNSSNNIYAGIYVMDDPVNDLSFVDMTTNEYRNLVIQPMGIDVSSDGYVYIAQNGVGVAKIKYEDCADFMQSEANSVINVNLVVNPSIIASSQDIVNLTYVVYNAGSEPLSNITLEPGEAYLTGLPIATDIVPIWSGDPNGNDQLDPGEVWFYSAVKSFDYNPGETFILSAGIVADGVCGQEIGASAKLLFTYTND